MVKLVIEEMFAFVAEDEQGEGVMGFMDSRNMQWVPLVGADMDRVSSLYPIAVDISLISGKPFKVLKFSKREDITEEVNLRDKADKTPA
jgi:hypothetical protein